MPDRPKRFCLGHCGRIVSGKYCEQCGAKRQQKRREQVDDRVSACKRGYDRRWRGFRLVYLSKHPLCLDCLQEQPQRLTTATDVHHVQKLQERPDLRLEETNLLALCGEHHDRRTARGE